MSTLSDQTQNSAILSDASVEDSSSSTILITDFQTNAIYEVVCEKCKERQSVNSVNYTSDRKNLKEFLDNNLDGIEILTYYKRHKTLSNNMQDKLVHLLISREIVYIFKANGVSLENPLKHLL